MKYMKKMAWGLLIVFVLIQFYRPSKNIAESDTMDSFMTETNPSKELKIILKQACFDCHSNNTVYPWYNNIAPISFWLDAHIKDGKKHLNFSEWENYSVKKKDHKMEELEEMIREGAMPLKEYTWTHKEAKLTPDQKQAILDWADHTRALYQLGPKPE
ncbi:heme-binding domain-containing protein [Arenibacter sp. 6A1]|uniref:heme-binding domain-containing protein n=1 Tax=Arenibacter sp. 6A1 TaxID=2720391 RepID=UPI0014476337|nr:heme-binding domain-containing protein [Arenibacter sp. 6A1]NKI27273.1 heme-binding domain-containing protein [Arenibacter sp. 6A1]